MARYSRINRAVVLYDPVKVNLVGSGTTRFFSFPRSSIFAHTYPHIINLSSARRVKASTIVYKIITFVTFHFNDLVMQIHAILSVSMVMSSSLPRHTSYIINCNSRLLTLTLILNLFRCQFH